MRARAAQRARSTASSAPTRRSSAAQSLARRRRRRAGAARRASATPLILRELEGRTYEQIAAELDVVGRRRAPAPEPCAHDAARRARPRVVPHSLVMRAPRHRRAASRSPRAWSRSSPRAAAPRALAKVGTARSWWPGAVAGGAVDRAARGPARDDGSGRDRRRPRSLRPSDRRTPARCCPAALRRRGRVGAPSRRSARVASERRAARGSGRAADRRRPARARRSARLTTTARLDRGRRRPLGIELGQRRRRGPLPAAIPAATTPGRRDDSARRPSPANSGPGSDVGQQRPGIREQRLGLAAGAGSGSSGSGSSGSGSERQRLGLERPG